LLQTLHFGRLHAEISPQVFHLLSVAFRGHFEILGGGLLGGQLGLEELELVGELADLGVSFGLVQARRRVDVGRPRGPRRRGAFVGRLRQRVVHAEGGRHALVHGLHLGAELGLAFQRLVARQLHLVIHRGGG